MSDDRSEANTFIIGARTDTGQVRKHNEDYVGYHIPSDPAKREVAGSLLVVCDGVGGAAAGEVASERAVHRVLNDYYAQTSSGSVEDQLVLAIENANAEIYRMNASRRDEREMATTIVAAVLLKDRVIIGHVGDSRAYLVRNGKIKQVTVDHSWVDEMVRSGDLTPEEAAVHPWRNRITRGLGMSHDVLVDIEVFTPQQGDILVLCSDGLTRHVHEEEIADVVRQSSVEQAVRRLIDLANLRGGKDNISVIVAASVSELESEQWQQYTHLDELPTQIPSKPSVPARLILRSQSSLLSVFVALVFIAVISGYLLINKLGPLQQKPTPPPAGTSASITPTTSLPLLATPASNASQSNPTPTSTAVTVSVSSTIPPQTPTQASTKSTPTPILPTATPLPPANTPSPILTPTSEIESPNQIECTNIGSLKNHINSENYKSLEQLCPIDTETLIHTFDSLALPLGQEIAEILHVDDQNNKIFIYRYPHTSNENPTERELDYSILDTAISVSGKYYVVGMKKGLLDSSQDNAWPDLGSVNRLALSRDGRFLVVSYEQNGMYKVAVKDLSNKEQDFTYLTKKSIDSPFLDLSLSDDGSIVAAVNGSNDLYLFVKKKNGKYSGNQEPIENVVKVAVASNGKRLALGTTSGEVILYEVILVEPFLKNLSKKSIDKSDAEITALAFSPKASVLAFGDKEGNVYVMGVDQEPSPEKIIPGGGDNEVIDLVFSDNGMVLGILAKNKSLRLWGVP